MKSSLKILSFFIAGLFFGFFSLLPKFFLDNDLTLYILYCLIFFVGFGIGCDISVLETIKNLHFKIFLVPLTVIIGTFIGVSIINLVTPDISLRDSLAVGAGFGYYSLSSVIIAGIRGEILGVIALVSNIAREIFTLIATPLLVKYFGSLAPVTSGGATAMDTTLPVIAKYTGKQYAIIAMFSGLILTILVPILVTLILKN